MLFSIQTVKREIFPIEVRMLQDLFYAITKFVKETLMINSNIFLSDQELFCN